MVQKLYRDGFWVQCGRGFDVDIMFFFICQDCLSELEFVELFEFLE